MSVNVGLELPLFDPTAKKKRKKRVVIPVITKADVAKLSPFAPPAVATAAPTVPATPEETLDDFNFGSKKKKKKAVLLEVPVEDKTELKVSKEPIEEREGFYDYYSLLSRVCEKLGKQAEQQTTINIPALQIDPDGTTKTTWRNIDLVAKKLRREPDHIKQYVTAELAAEGTFDLAGRLTLRGRFRLPQFQTVIRHYVNEYVKCNVCLAHDTSLDKIRGQSLSIIKCNGCHSQRSVQAISKGFRATTKKDRRDEKKKS